MTAPESSNTPQQLPHIPHVDPDEDSVLDGALAYAAAGLYVGPVQPGTKRPHNALGRGWPAKTSRDPREIAAWFAGIDDAVFLHAGRSGLVVFDVDRPEACPPPLAAAIAEHAPPHQCTRVADDVDTLDDTAVARAHYVFALPDRVQLGNGPGDLGRDWGDVRGNNGLIVVAPSRHVKADEGGAYRWRRTGPIPEVPAELLALLPRRTDSTGTIIVPEGGASSDEVAAYLDTYDEAIAPHTLKAVLTRFDRGTAGGGSRHESMVDAACFAMRDARAGLYPARHAHDELRALFARHVGRDRAWEVEWAGIIGWAVARACDDTAEFVAARRARVGLDRARRADAPERPERRERPVDPWAPIRVAPVAPRYGFDEVPDTVEPAEPAEPAGHPASPESACAAPTPTPPAAAEAGRQRPDAGQDDPDTDLEPPDDGDGEGGEDSESDAAAVRREQLAAMVLPPAFWDARPVLRRIRDAAYSRNRCPDVVLHAVLARVASYVDHRTVVDTGIGEASLNVYAMAVGVSGGGKSTGLSIANRVLPGPDDVWPGDDYREGAVGSGEGLAEAFMGTRMLPTGERDLGGAAKLAKKRTQVRHNAFLTVDEGEQVFRMAERSGSTLMTTLRSAWVGERLGQLNASAETTRQIAGGSYALGLVVGIQPTKAGPLFGDAAGGTPQRFLFASAVSPHIPAVPPSWPGALALSGVSTRRTLTVHPDIAARVRAEDTAVSRGELARPDLDSHEPLHLAKVAGLLAVLEDRDDVTLDDWSLAEQVWATSRTVRDRLVDAIARADEAVHRAGDEREAARRARVMDTEEEVAAKRLDRLERAAELSVAHKVWRSDGPCTRRALQHAINSRSRRDYGPGLVDAAIGRAVRFGYLAEAEAGWEPGIVRPEDVP